MVCIFFEHYTRVVSFDSISSVFLKVTTKKKTGNMDHILLEALPVENFKEGEIVKVYAQKDMLNNFLATTVFDLQKPKWRAVSTQVICLLLTCVFLCLFPTEFRKKNDRFNFTHNQTD